MKLGDKVRWWSQSGGYLKKKEGEIWEIVPKGMAPHQLITTATELGGGRNHESYVIRVGNKTYWPRVSALRRTRKFT